MKALVLAAIVASCFAGSAFAGSCCGAKKADAASCVDKKDCSKDKNSTETAKLATEKK